MLVRNARRSAFLGSTHGANAAPALPNEVEDREAAAELRDAVSPLVGGLLEAEQDDGEDHNDDDNDDHDNAGEREGSSTQTHQQHVAKRRSTSAFNRSNGIVLSTSYLTATYGGAPGFYSLRLGEKCTSTVVVHLQCTGESISAATSKDGSLRLSCDRLEFTPTNFAEPQIVRVELLEPCGGTHMVLHRVFSLDKNYDRLVTPSVVVKTERSIVGSLLSLGGALVHKRKNAKGEIMEPRLAANRTIDLAKALTSTVAVGTAIASMAAVTSAFVDGSISSTSLGAAPATTQCMESQPLFVSHMAAGHSFSSLVVKPQGGLETLLVWGMNTNGELGIGSTTPMVDPVPLTLPPQTHGDPVSVVSIACGKHHAALVTTHGRLFTWGNNKYGQLGLGDYTNVDTPREVIFAGALFRAPPSHQRALRLKHAMLEHGNTNVTQVACGSFHTLFVTHQQHVLSMGYNQAGQLGLGHRLQQLKGWRSCTPAMVEKLRDSCILDLAAGQNHSACVLSNGDVYVWGCGGDGRLGVPLGQGVTGEAAARQAQSECEVLPVPVLSLKDFGVKARTVRCGGRHTAIVSDRDLLYVWGANEFGQLGLADKRNRGRPCLVQFPPFLHDGVVDVSLGEFHSACVTWGGDAYVWGLDLSGEYSTRLDQRCSPERILLPTTDSAVRIACGWAHTTVITQNSRDHAGDERTASDTTSMGTRKPVHVHRRKEKALKYSTRQQEAAKWKQVSNAVALMGRLQRRVTEWKQKKTKKTKSKAAESKKLSLAQVVNSASMLSRRSLLQESEREKVERLKVVAKSFVEGITEEALKRVILIRSEKCGNTRRKKKKEQNRPPSAPERRVKPVKAAPPAGVFYNNGLQILLPPTIPPPCLSPPPTSPRNIVLSPATRFCADNDSSSPRTPRPPSPSNVRPRKSRPSSAMVSPRSIQSQKNATRQQTSAPVSLTMTASCASLLSALQDDNPRDEDEIGHQSASAAPASSKRYDAVVESLLHRPSFSLASHLVEGGSRRVRSSRHRHTCR